MHCSYVLLIQIYRLYGSILVFHVHTPKNKRSGRGQPTLPAFPRDTHENISTRGKARRIVISMGKQLSSARACGLRPAACGLRGKGIPILILSFPRGLPALRFTSLPPTALAPLPGTNGLRANARKQFAITHARVCSA